MYLALTLLILQGFGHVDAAKGDWHPGRATYFDAPQYWKDSFQPGKFGDLYGNSCQYVDRIQGVTPSNAEFPLPIDGVGAVTDVMPYNTGLCGRCFEVRCKTGTIFIDKGVPMSIHEGYYLPKYAPKGLKDPEGRKWPGIPKDKDQEIKYTQCRDNSTTAVITIIDACPCTYIGGRQQKVCCGPIDHFDLSFWAFNKLAHPLYGLMMLDYRPVDCATHEPIDDGKPYISNKIYGDRPQSGWGWATYSEKNSSMIADGEGLGGSAATCVTLTPKGGLAFWCRECHLPGAQPFNKTRIQFWVRSDASSEKSPFTFTPKGKAPKLKLFLSQMHELVYTKNGTTREPEKFCDNKPDLANYQSTKKGNWYFFKIPLVDFGCSRNLTTATTNRLAFTNPGSKDAIFCLDDLEIV